MVLTAGWEVCPLALSIVRANAVASRWSDSGSEMPSGSLFALC